MQPPNPPDDALAELFERLRADTLARVRPPGAAAARANAHRRQYQRRRGLATAAAVLGMVLAGSLGTGVARFAVLQGTQRVTHTAEASGSTTAGTTPSVAPAPPRDPGTGPGVRTADGSTTTHRDTRTASPAPSTSPPYQITRCHTGELSASLSAPADPAPSGMMIADLGLTNQGEHPCRMYGYPGMALLTSAGTPLPTKVVRDGSVAPALFVLQPGDTGWARLSWSVTPDPDETAPCTPDAQGLWVTPPDEFTQLTVQVALNVCHQGEIDTGPTRP